MKKKLLVVVMMAALSVSMTACGTKEAPKKENTNQEVTEEGAQSENKNTDAKDDAENNDIDDNDEEVKSKKDSYYYSNGLNGVVYISEDGSVSGFQSCEDLVPGGFMCEANGQEAFYMKWEDEGYIAYCYDFESGEYYDLETSDVETINYYNGKLYLTSTKLEYDDDNGESTVYYNEYVYEKNEAGKYELTDTKEEYLAELGGSILRLNDTTYYNAESVGCALEKYGNVVIDYFNGTYALGDVSGVLKEFVIDEENQPSILGRTKDYLICTLLDENYTSSGLLAYDLNDGDILNISDDSNALLAVDTEKNILYYYKSMSEDFGVNSREIDAIDLENNEVTVIGEFDTPAGMDTIICGTTGFAVADGRVYFANVDANKKVTINMAEQNGDTWKVTDTGFEVKEYNGILFDYGSVDYYTYTQNCSDCNKPSYKFYYEYFQLDDRFEHAEEINKSMAEEAEFSYNEALESGGFTEECEYHENDYAVSFFENRISNISLIGNHYIQVATNSYWFGGGAHGMPGQDYKMFDLSTGQRVKLSDVYLGTQEELDEIVFQKTLEEYELGEQGFFEYTEADLREATAGRFDINNENVEYTETGINFYYAPYELGPFASGFITVFISYDELGIEAFQN